MADRRSVDELLDDLDDIISELAKKDMSLNDVIKQVRQSYPEPA